MTDGVTVTPDTNDPEIVSVTVDDSVIGDVVLYASYNDTNGNLIIGAPVVVVSRPPGVNVSGIELVPNEISLTTGSSVDTAIWADYDNGTRSQLFIPSGAAIIYSSEDPAVASVDSTGKIVLNAPGTTNIHVSYLGFSAQSSVNVSALPPPPAIAPIISGTISYCANPSLGPVPDVTFTLTGDATTSAISDASGNYQFSFLSSGGSYIVTPTKSALTPGSAGINTVDVIATQRHFLNLGTPLSGCRLTAADVNGDTLINTVDVIAIQRFFLGLSTGIANTGKYQFTPANRTYTGDCY